ncbi:MAG: glycoside hydrolase family 95 protein [Treponema sp.]|jgi:alpha-L-fucosidase 2|nr:glycoside hydrolase family 95 protein [Treponema sp.]
MECLTTKKSNNKLNFPSPAKQWEEALPLGNGRLGAMVYGIPGREKIQLNEDSIWSGNYHKRNNPAAKDALPEVRRLLSEGKAREAEELCLESFSGIPPSQRVYQTAGELQIDFSPEGGFGHTWSSTHSDPLITGYRNYSRELDIANAVHTLTFEYNETLFTRECFISAPANLMVLRFTAKTANREAAGDLALFKNTAALGKISFRANLDRGVFFDRKGNIEDAAFITRDGDIPFCAMIKVVQMGGTQTSRGGFITVHNANEALLFLDIRTGFRETKRKATGNVAVYNDACSDACLANINRQANRSWEELLQEHVTEYHSWYNRMELNIDEGSGAASNGTTVRYHNFCRYLLISCSRSGTLPANLQGLWNHHIDPPWGSDYTININTQMNYWAACMCNLAETEEPLFDLLERMYPNGKITAQEMYGCRGFTAHHNTNIWGDTAPRDYWLPGSYWVLGAAWLSLHVWEHYEYTQDKKFLEKYFYLLKEACLFFVDFLIPGKQTNENGDAYLVVSPSVSPENSYRNSKDPASASYISSLCEGCEMDNQILRKLFSATIRAAEILETANTSGCNTTTNRDTANYETASCDTGDDIKQFHSILERLPAPAIHPDGTIREWLNEDFEEAEPGHRHFSHLWALMPGDAITKDETPKLAAAARKSIDRRLAADGGHTGWSRAWLVNFMARLGDGEAALEHLNAIFSDFTLPNLFNTHPPFQIDGNFGALAGITQMLLQSRIHYTDTGHQVVIDLLPALPKEWSSGSFRGIRAKGNLEVDAEWQDGRLTSVSIQNNSGKTATVVVRYSDETKEHELPPNVCVRI